MAGTVSQVFLVLFAFWMVMITHQNCTAGIDPVSSLITSIPFQINSTLLLDSRNPVTCNGTVNAWRYCYFTDWTRLDLSENDSIGLWRQIDNTSYELVDESLLNLDTVVEFELIDFVCVRHIVSPFNVTEGNVIGAVISSNLSAFSLVRPAENGSLTMAIPTPNHKVVDNGVIEGFALYVEAYFEADLPTSTTQVSVNMATPGNGAELWLIFFTSFLALLVLVLGFIVCVTIVMLVRNRNKKYGITEERNVELSQQLRNQASTPTDNAPPLQNFQHQSSSISLPSASFEEPGSSALQNQSSIHVFSYPPPDKRAPLPPPSKTPPGSLKKSTRSPSLPNLPTTPTPGDVALHRQTSSIKPESPLSLGPEISPDASNGVAPLQSTSLPVCVGEAFTNDGAIEDVSQSVHVVRKHSYVNVKKTRLGRLQSAPLTTDPEYAEPIVVSKRGRLYSEQPAGRVPRGSHKPRPPLTKTVGFEIPTKISAATIIKNSLMHNSSEKLNVVDSPSLEKIVEADENEALSTGSRQGSTAAPEMYLEPVKTPKSKK